MTRLLITKKIGQLGYCFMSVQGNKPSWHQNPNLAEDFAASSEERLNRLLKEHEAELVWWND